jgi:hypothetical protein
MEESSNSVLLELIEGVLDPVLDDGDCKGDSFVVPLSNGGEKASVFSLPVMASEIALKPVARDPGKVVFCATGDGTGGSMDEVSDARKFGDAATSSMLGVPYSNFVTVGEPGEVGVHDLPICGPLVARDPDLPKYVCAADELDVFANS